MLERNMTVEAAVMENPKVLKEIQKLGGEYDFIAMESLEDALKSLGEKLDKPVAKSTVNHRMKKIIELADSL